MPRGTDMSQPLLISIRESIKFYWRKRNPELESGEWRMQTETCAHCKQAKQQREEFSKTLILTSTLPEIKVWEWREKQTSNVDLIYPDWAQWIIAFAQCFQKQKPWMCPSHAQATPKICWCSSHVNQRRKYRPRKNRGTECFKNT